MRAQDGLLPTVRRVANWKRRIDCPSVLEAPAYMEAFGRPRSVVAVMEHHSWRRPRVRQHDALMPVERRVLRRQRRVAEDQVRGLLGQHHDRGVDVAVGDVRRWRSA